MRPRRPHGLALRLAVAGAIAAGALWSLAGFTPESGEGSSAGRSLGPLCGIGSPIDTNMFSPATEQAATIADVTWLVTGICVAILAVVEGLLIFAVIRYRQRESGSSRARAGRGDPPQVYGSGPIELAWTVSPLLIVLVLSLVAARAIFDIGGTPPPGAMPVTVVGHRWWWEFRYPGLGIVTANELCLPAGSAAEPKPVSLTLTSADVVHSFWVPRLAGKMDVFPGRNTSMWFAPTTPGTYYGQCAEYCGTQHAQMLIRVIVLARDEWEKWVRDQARPAPVSGPGPPDAAARGRDAFMSLACASCHRIGGTQAAGTFGPDLTHLMSRHTIGSGIVANTQANLHAWVVNPQALKPGCNMPAMNLDDQQLAAVLDYLESLH